MRESAKAVHEVPIEAELKQQTPAGDFTKKVRLNLSNWKPVISMDDVRIRTIVKWLEEACEFLDAKQQPLAGDFTEKLRKFVNMYENEIPRRAEITFLKEAYDFIASSLT